MNRNLKMLGLALVAALALAALTAPAASAAFGFKETELSFLDSSKEPVKEAGGHPFTVKSKFEMNSVPAPFPREELPDGGEAKDIVVDLPEGLVGDPNAVPTCKEADFTQVKEWRSGCPDETVVGIVTLHLALDQNPGVFDAPIYNLDPPPGVALQLGIVATTIPVTVDIRISQKPPYHAIAEGLDLSQVGILFGAELNLWGNPASEAHDPLRGNCLAIEREVADEPASKGNCPVDIEEKALVTLPRACEGDLETLFEADSWLAPGAFVTDTATTAGMEGCEELGLDASIDSQPTTAQAASAAGLEFELNVDDPGLTDPSQNAGSDIKKTVVTLPEGVTVNPSQAEGLGACTEAGYESLDLASQPGEGCPNSSKIGTAEVETPLLEETLEGSIYLAQPFENPTDSLIALYMVLREPQRGIFVKLPGKVEPDASTGQLVATFEDLPQLPFSRFHLTFTGGERAPLITPAHCGTYTTEAVLTPWANPTEPITATSTFTVTSGPGGNPCPPAPLPFGPSFSAGTADPLAGAFSPLAMRIQRSDSEQDISRFSATLPPGLLAKVAGMSQCPQGQIDAAKARSGASELASPSCQEASRLGSTLAGAGAGAALTYVPGKIYLAGPYQGAPLSVAAIVPALAGPFDLGTVVVQEGLNLNPVTGDAEVLASDPLPRILQGIPLHLRDLQIAVDRPSFSLNASGCDPTAFKAELTGSEGTTTTATSPYRATGCDRLDFAPRLTFALKGQMKRSGNPAVTSVLTPRPGDTNIGRAVVTLPASELIDNSHINNPCTRVQFNADACPKASILGTAKAETPLLDAPLEGPVYFRSNGGERELPDIVADLHGLFRITVVGFVDSKNKRIRTTFANVPDAPVSKFTIKLYGGKRGLLENNRNLCRVSQRALVKMEGQNSRRYQFEPKIQKPSCKGKGKGKKGGGGKKRR